MKVISFKNLFDDNNYDSEMLKLFKITIGGVNYLPHNVCKRFGLLYYKDDIEVI